MIFHVLYPSSDRHMPLCKLFKRETKLRKNYGELRQGSQTGVRDNRTKRSAKI